jgi:AraC-like DNA-binding protein
MQTFSRSSQDLSKLCSFDQEVIEAPTAPLIHQEARFLFIKDGSGTINIQNKRYDLTPNTIVAIFPWQITEVTEVREALQYYLVIYNLDTLNRMVKFFGDSMGDTIDWMDHIMQSPVIFCKEKSAEASHIFEELKAEMGVESALDSLPSKPLSNLAAMDCIIRIIIFCERTIREEFIKAEGNSNEHDLSEILRYMYCHCNEKLSLKTLSKLFYRCESALSSYITSITGMSFFDLLNEMRIGKAANYMLYTDLNVEELAEILGYVDASHLSKVFSERTGTKISEYRHTYQNAATVCRVGDGPLPYFIVEYIYRNYKNDLTCKKVAEKFSISAVELNRLLLCQVEKNFDEFLNFIRINHACKLLLTTNDTITYVAMEVGYNNAKTFNRNFLRLKVMNPSDFRRNVTLQEKVINAQEPGRLKSGGPKISPQ